MTELENAIISMTKLFGDELIKHVAGTHVRMPGDETSDRDYILMGQGATMALTSLATMECGLTPEGREALIAEDNRIKEALEGLKND